VPTRSRPLLPLLLVLAFTLAACQSEVTWRFDDGSVPHDVKGDGFASKIQSRGTFSHRFTQAGEFRYKCTLHAGMEGRVVVAAGDNG
jgi:plastocyanin